MSGTSTESPSGSFVRKPSDPPIIDQFGNNWTISQDGHVVVDGQYRRLPAGTPATEIAYFNRLIWGWSQPQQLWWHTAGFGQPWLPSGGTPNAPFGPTPDPRLDNLIAQVAALSQQVSLLATVLVGAIQNLQNDVTDIPTEIIPDPQIGQIAAALSTFMANTGVAVSALSSKIDSLATASYANQTAILAQLQTVETQLLTNQAGQDANAATLSRILVGVLALISPQKKGSIKIGTDNMSFTSQSAPTKSGP